MGPRNGGVGGETAVTLLSKITIEVRRQRVKAWCRESGAGPNPQNENRQMFECVVCDG